MLTKEKKVRVMSAILAVFFVYSLKKMLQMRENLFIQVSFGGTELKELRNVNFKYSLKQ